MRKIILCILLCIIAGCSSNESTKVTSSIHNEKTININEEFNITDQWHGDLVFCGMISDNKFSIAGTSRTAVNFYYPIKTKQIIYKENIINIISVNATSITYKIIK